MNEIACLNCGLVNEETGDEGRCRLCGARLSLRQVDPLLAVTFGADCKRLPLARIVERNLFGLAGGELLTARIRMWGVATLRRSLGRPWVVPLYRGRVFRFRPISLTDQAPVDRNEVERLTKLFISLGFEPVMDRMIESVFATPFQRLLVAQGRRLYATLTLVPGAPPAVGVWAPQGKEGMTLVTDTPPDLTPDPQLRVAFTPGATPKEMVETAESMTTANDRAGAPFGAKEFSVFILNSHERAIDRGVEEKRLRKMRTRKGRLIDDGIPPSCARHRSIRATRECLVCGKPLCDLCVRQVAEGDFCADHLPEGALPPGEPTLDLTGDLRPAGPLIRSALAAGEPLLLWWGMSRLFPADGPAGSQIAALGLMALLFPAWFLYPLARWGATPLGRLCGVAMVDTHGDPPTWPAALVKTGLLFLTGMTLLPVVGFLPVMWDRYRRSWADRMAGVVTVTHRPAAKEVVGLLLWAALAGGGYSQQERLTAGIEGLFDAAPFAGGERLPFASLWRVKTTHKPLLDQEGLFLADGKRLGAVRVADRAIRWETRLDAPPDRLALDPYGRALAVVAGPRIDGYDLAHGGATYAVTLPGAPTAGPLFLPRGIVVALPGKLACYDRGGGRLWERPLDAPPVGLDAFHRFLFLTTGKGGSELLDDATGESRQTFDGLRLAAPYGDEGVLLAGNGRVALFTFAAGRLYWEVPGAPGGPATADLKAASLIPLADRLVMADTGAERFVYPEGFAPVGAGGSWLVTGDGETLTLIDAIRGAATGRVAIPGVTRAWWAGPAGKGGGRFLLLSGARVRLLTLTPRGEGSLAPAGGTIDPDAAFTLVGSDRLLVTTTRGAGLYRLSP